LKSYAIEVAKNEGVTLDAPGAEIVAMFGDGSYRDTLSVLEKVLHSATKGALHVDTVAQIVGAPTHDLVDRVLRAIEAGDIADGLLAIGEANAKHVHMKVYHAMILAKLRAVLLLRYAPRSESELAQEFTPDDLAFIKELSLSPARAINSHVLLAFLTAGSQLGFSAIPSLPLELALVRIVDEKKK
jgi:DNA polymerase III gamma/tau subunit